MLLGLVVLHKPQLSDDEVMLLGFDRQEQAGNKQKQTFNTSWHRCMELID